MTINPYDLGINDTTINQVPIQSISWGKFKGQIPEHAHYYAHIFWSIDYRYYFNDSDLYKPLVIPKPIISAKSWVREDKSSQRLLRHQYGHYLIGCLCALKFQEAVNSDKTTFETRGQAIKFIQQKFKQILNYYLEIEKKYDQETDHFYVQCEQRKWQEWIAKEINSMNNEVVQKRKSKSTEKSIVSDRRISSIERKSSKQSREGASVGRYRSNKSIEVLRDLTNCLDKNRCSIKPLVNYPPIPKSRQKTSN